MLQQISGDSTVSRTQVFVGVYVKEDITVDEKSGCATT
jgi:hypothetical protein